MILLVKDHFLKISLDNLNIRLECENTCCFIFSSLKIDLKYQEILVEILA